MRHISKILKALLMIILVSLFSLNAYAYLAAIKSTAPLRIITANSITVKIKQGSEFKLPRTIIAKMNNGENKSVLVKWNKEYVNTNSSGIYKFYGTINGYSKKIILSLTIEKLTVQDIAKENNKIVFLKIYNSKNEYLSSGSGFLISQDGRVVTNYHVIEYADHIKAILSNSQEYNITSVMDYDKGRDIAILKMVSNKNLPFVKLGNSDKVKIGERVVAIDNPYGLKNTVLSGSISGINKESFRKSKGIKDIQISAPIIHGSSGGAVFNMLGQVIGIVYSGNEYGNNSNFVIPINELKNLTYNKNITLSQVYKNEHIVIYNNGRYEGNLVNGKRDGYGIYKWSNGNKYTGEWVDGEINGKGTFTYADETYYEGSFVNGHYEGFGVMHYKDGIYSGEWKNDKQDGKGEYRGNDGYVYIGDYKNNLNDGQGNLTWPNGDKYVGAFKNGYREGEGVYTYSNGKIISGLWKNDKFVEENTNIPVGVWAKAVSSSEIQIGWDYSAAADYYYIYYGISYNGYYEPFKNTDGTKMKIYWYSQCSGKLFGLIGNSTRYFKITAVKNGVESQFSSVVSATTLVN